jgi:hypothetical protein
MQTVLKRQNLFSNFPNYIFFIFQLSALLRLQPTLNSPSVLPGRLSVLSSSQLTSTVPRYFLNIVLSPCFNLIPLRIKTINLIFLLIPEQRTLLSFIADILKRDRVSLNLIHSKLFISIPRPSHKFAHKRKNYLPLDVQKMTIKPPPPSVFLRAIVYQLCPTINSRCFFLKPFPVMRNRKKPSSSDEFTFNLSTCSLNGTLRGSCRIWGWQRDALRFATSRRRNIPSCT